MTRQEFEAVYTVHYEHAVEFGEVDMLRHVNNVRYAAWAETVRMVYFHQILERENAGSEGMILAKHDMIFEAPIGYRERVVIGGRIVRWAATSFEFECAVFVPALERIAFRSLALLVAYDYEAKRSIPVPPRWRSAVAALG